MPHIIEEMTIVQMRRSLDAGECSVGGLAAAYLERINTHDAAGPKLNAVIELNPQAPEIAASLDEELRTKGPRSRLHGIPVMLKDNIATADGMSTSAGSLALADSVAPRDAFVVGRLRQAGALILGKTNLSEWANFRSTRSTSGWSSRGGQTRNPYVLDRSPCGSSAGSGVAVAANLCAAAVGTETDGSIVGPAAMNGVVGLKPTVGLLSRSGIVPIAHSQDTAGPMTRTVEDAALMLGVLAGVDDADGHTKERAGRALEDYTRFLDPAGLAGARIGVARRFAGFHEQVDRRLEECLEVMRGLGAEIIDPVEIAHTDQLGANERQVLLYEFKAGLNQYLAGLGPQAPVGSLAAVIEFNERHRQRVMPFFGQERLHQAQEMGPLTDKAYLDALATNHRLSRREGIDATLAKHRLAAIVAPTAGLPSPIDLINGDHFLGGFSSPAAVAGYAHITVPAGCICGLPLGLSFVGGAYGEGTLIKLAYAFEQEANWRQSPGF